MDLTELIKNLDKAEKLLSEFRGGYSDHYFSAQEFHKDFVKQLDLLKSKNMEALDYFKIWFTPSYDWDDFTNGDGCELENEISNLLELNKEL